MLQRPARTSAAPVAPTITWVGGLTAPRSRSSRSAIATTGTETTVWLLASAGSGPAPCATRARQGQRRTAVEHEVRRDHDPHREAHRAARQQRRVTAAQTARTARQPAGALTRRGARGRSRSSAIDVRRIAPRFSMPTSNTASNPATAGWASRAGHRQIGGVDLHLQVLQLAQGRDVAPVSATNCPSSELGELL